MRKAKNVMMCRIQQGMPPSFGTAIHRKSSPKSAQIVIIIMSASVTLWSSIFRVRTFGFDLCFRCSFVANLVALSAFTPELLMLPCRPSPVELRLISWRTRSSCGSFSRSRGVHTSSSRPVHCGCGTIL